MCFKPIKNRFIYEILRKDNCLCNQCQKRLVPKFIKFSIDEVDALSIYIYDDNIKSLLYQFKGCYDYEMKDVFINQFKNELHLIYRGYSIVPVPSYGLDDENRGFNHVEEIFKNINLPFIKCVEKIAHFKQAEHKRKSRKDISKYLVLNNKEALFGKKILIVDDVVTTGSTMKTMVSLIREGNPKDIKILVLAKREMN